MGCADAPGGRGQGSSVLPGRTAITEDRVQVSDYALFLTHVPEICGCIFVYWIPEMKAGRAPLALSAPAVRLAAGNAYNVRLYGAMDAPSSRRLRNAVPGPTENHTALLSKA
jgi:hypothetical protein